MFSQSEQILQFCREYGSQTTEDGRVVKPWISLSGDDDGKHYILYPDSEDTDVWTYSIEMIIDTGMSLTQEGFMVV